MAGKISKRYVSCCGVRNAEVAQFFITLRGGQRPFGRILNFSMLRSKQSTLELFDIIFEKGSSKGPSGKNITNNEILQLSTDSGYLLSVAFKSIITTRKAGLDCLFCYGYHLYMFCFCFNCSLVIFCLLCFHVSYFIISQPFVLKCLRSWIQFLSHDGKYTSALYQFTLRL